MSVEFGEDLVSSLGITTCCYCIDHALGVTLLGVINVGMAIIGLLLILWWIVLAQDDCDGFVYISPDKNCTQYLGPPSQFREELSAISQEMQNYKLRFSTLIGLTIAVCGLWFTCSLLLTFGAYKEKKLWLIPWLIIVKISTLLLVVLTVCIIFLEARLFAIGTTVFGLFSLLTLFLACLMAYLWLVTQSLYNRLEQIQFEPRGLQYGNGYAINQGFSFEDYVDILSVAQMRPMATKRTPLDPNETDMYEIHRKHDDPSWEELGRTNGCTRTSQL